MSELADSASAEQPIHYLDFGQVRDLFLDRGLPEYLKCIQGIEWTLSQIESTVRDDQDANVTLALPLRPSIESSAFLNSQRTAAAVETRSGRRLYYKPELPQPTRDMLMLTELLTHSQAIADTRDENGRGKVVSRGHYEETPVFFIETYQADNMGEYMTWAASTRLPAELVSSYDEVEKPFLTTGQADEITHDVLDNLAEWPTAFVDEEDVVKSWIRREAA